MKNRITRRSFIKGTAAAAGAVAVGTGCQTGAPTIVPSSALGADGAVAPSNRIALGVIGTGDHGTKRDIALFSRQPDAQIVALCDVDTDRIEGAVDFAREKLHTNLADCFTTRDWREVVARDDIDAVVIATPDHWHVLPAIAAAKAGKDVFGEKPLSLTVQEGRVLCDTVKKHKRVTITASENRSRENFLRVCELVRNGRIGKVHTIRTELPAGRWIQNKPWSSRIGGDFAGNPPTHPPVPDNLDYNMWLGQAPWKPYTPAHLHWNWRWVLDYSGGMLTDWGAHMNDVAQWGNDTEYTGPISVEGHGKFPLDKAGYNTATEWEVTCEYRNGVTLICTSGAKGRVRFEGTDGWVQCEFYGPVQASSDKILNSVVGPEEIHLRTCPGEEQRDFLDCVKSREDTYAPFEVGHRTITISHIGNISMQLGRKLRWNPDTERFVNDESANEKLSRAMRAPWHL